MRPYLVTGLREGAKAGPRSASGPPYAIRDDEPRETRARASPERLPERVIVGHVVVDRNGERASLRGGPKRDRELGLDSIGDGHGVVVDGRAGVGVGGTSHQGDEEREECGDESRGEEGRAHLAPPKQSMFHGSARSFSPRPFPPGPHKDMGGP